MPNKIAISIRLEPWLKKAAERVAREENRSLTNLIETLLLERCKIHKKGDSPVS
jgi:hypothetical protein